MANANITRPHAVVPTKDVPLADPVVRNDVAVQRDDVTSGEVSVNGIKMVIEQY